MADQPFLVNQLELLRRHRTRRVALLVAHLGEQIVEHVGDSGRFGLRVEYQFDGPRLLGTGGALRRALPRLGPLFWVTWGDAYLDFDWAAALAHFVGRPESGLMTVFRNAGRWDRSNVIFRDGKVVCYDKRRPTPEMAYIDYGASLLRAAALERIPTDEPYDLADLCQELAAEGALAGYEVDRRFYEVGSVDGLRETEAYLRKTDH